LVGALEPAAVRLHVVHDDERTPGRLVDARVVRARRPHADLRQELAVDVRLGEQRIRSVVEVALHTVGPDAPAPFGPLERNGEPDLVRESLRTVELLDVDDAL